MLPPGAFAVALLLNGVQIMLPAPAFVDQGRVWAPGREVLQRLGFTVRWEASERAFIALREQQRLRVPELPPPWITPATPEQALYSRRLGNILYMPLLALRALGLKTAWDPAHRSVWITDPAPARVPLAALLHNPSDWLGRTVILTGEYTGWDSDPSSYATAGPPPTGSGDWVLTTADGAVYCTPGPAYAAPVGTGLAAVTPARPPLTPYGLLGQRLEVTGQVLLAPTGAPYLRYAALHPLTGSAGIGCRLVLDRQVCRLGEAQSWTVVVRNPGPGELRLPPEGQMLVSVSVPGPSLHVFKQSVNCLTQTVVPAGEEVEIRGSWRVPLDAPQGGYAIVVGIGDLQTFVQRFEVVEARSE